MGIWILVADSNRARLLQSDSPAGSLRESEDFVHPEARSHEQQITSDLPGSQRGASGHHHVDPATGIKEREAIDFSKFIGTKLDVLRNKNSLDRLWIVAEPHFLGHLRKELKTETLKLVAGEIDKNLVQHSTDDIRAHLPDRL